MLWLSNNSVHYYEGIRRCLESKPLGWIQIWKQSFWCHDQLSPRLVLTRNSSAQFQPIWTVMWEASMRKHCPVREADTETAFTIFPFPCKSNFLKILTYITPSPSHLHFLGVGQFFWSWGEDCFGNEGLLQSKGPRDASDTGKFQMHFLSSFSQHHHMELNDTSSFLSVLA